MTQEVRMRFGNWTQMFFNALLAIVTGLSAWVATNVIEIKTQNAVISTKIEQAIAIDKKVEELDKKYNDMNVILNRLCAMQGGKSGSTK